jgi:hypothetical protein
MKERLRRWVWGIGGALVVGLIVYHVSQSPEWRTFQWERLWSLLRQARPDCLLASVLAVYATYVVRAYRWKFFLDPIKRASPWVLFVGQVLGFSSIYLIGRPGELVRPAYIARKTGVSFTAMLAVWLLERIFDVTCMVLLFSVALSTLRVGHRTARGELVLAQMQTGGKILLAVTLLVVVALVAYRLDAERVRGGLLHGLRFLPHEALRALDHFLRSFAEGLGVIRSVRSFAASVAATALLWVLNVTVLWLVFRSLGPGLDHLSWLAGALVLFCGALGLVVQIPGIGGGFQVAMILALTEIFTVRAELATGAGVLIWVIVSGPCLALGMILLGYEGLTFKKLRAIAAEARAAGQEEAQP